MRQSQLTQQQKTVIREFADRMSYGDYELARRIDRREFNAAENNAKCIGIYASFYSILNVIRRYRASLVSAR